MLDVLVIAGGNVALTAAVMAREAGASVLMPEASPREWRGGNSQHMRNLRCMHAAPQDVTQRSLGRHASMPAVDPFQSLSARHRMIGLRLKAVERRQTPAFIRGTSAAGDCEVFR